MAIKIAYRVYVAGFEMVDAASPSAWLTSAEAIELCRKILDGKPAGTVGRIDRVRYSTTPHTREIGDAQHRAYVVGSDGIVRRTDR